LLLDVAPFAAEAAGDLDAWMNFIDDDPVWLPPNEPAVTDDGKSIWIVSRQRDGAWQPSRAIWNSDTPQATSP
jgi:ketosteroid isomerase-like protein